MAHCPLVSSNKLLMNRDNTVEIQLLDCFERKEIRADQFDRSQLGRELDTVSGRYMTKLRKTAARVFTKKATA
jgi:hypothetical protein